jgi:hypothetical protein
MTAAPEIGSLTLGELLSGARQRSGQFATWLQQADPGLSERLAAALAPGESATARVRAALADFAADATESDWATLISALRDSQDPGLEALRRMLLRSLAAQGAG